LVIVTSSSGTFEAAVRDAAQGWKFKPSSSPNRMRCKIRFAIYEKEEPNQSPEPTPTAGTSAAEQPLVPAAVVAHL
jgi:hypothetical protein